MKLEAKMSAISLQPPLHIMANLKDSYESYGVFMIIYNIVRLSADFCKILSLSKGAIHQAHIFFQGM